MNIKKFKNDLTHKIIIVNITIFIFEKFLIGIWIKHNY